VDRTLYNPSDDTPPNDAEIERLEETIGYRLPADFIAFVKDAQAGVPESNVIVLPDGHTTSLSCFDDFFELDENFALIRSNYAEDRLPPLLAFADDSVGNYFCLHLGAQNYGAVSFLEHEEAILQFLAPTFTDFLGLVKEDNSTPPVLNMDNVISVSGASLEEIIKLADEMRAGDKIKRAAKRIKP
jgi:hypothetical protein